MRACDHLELSRSCGGRVQLDPDVEHRALDRVAAHPAIAVPGQISEAGRSTWDLYDHAIAVETVLRVAQFRAAQAPDAGEAFVRAERGDQRRPLVQIVHAVARLDPVDRRPPRASVDGPGCGYADRDVCDELVELDLPTTPLR